jgi:hypothetical protein
MDSSWTTCHICDTEFQVITQITAPAVQFCPFCSAELEDGDSFSMPSDEESEE